MRLPRPARAPAARLRAARARPRRGGTALDRAAARGVAEPGHRRRLRPRRAVRCVAPLLRARLRPVADGDDLRGSAVGRPGTARLHGVPGDLVPHPAHPPPRPRPPGAARRAAHLGAGLRSFTALTSSASRTSRWQLLADRAWTWIRELVRPFCSAGGVPLYAVEVSGMLMDRAAPTGVGRPGGHDPRGGGAGLASRRDRRAHRRPSPGGAPAARGGGVLGRASARRSDAVVGGVRSARRRTCSMASSAGSC